MLSAFHSAVVEVQDFDAAVTDYARLLGQPPRWIESQTTRSVRSAFFGLSNTQLEIRASASGSEAETTARRSFGLVGIRFEWDPEASGDPQAFLSQRGVATGPTLNEEAVRSDGQCRRWTRIEPDLRSSRGIPVEIICGETGEVSQHPDGVVEPEATIESLDHVVVLSGAIEATRDFYADGLGLRLALDRSFEDRGVRLLFFRVGGTTVEVGGRLGTEDRPDAVDRFGGLAWRVPNVEAIQARLLAEQFDVSEVRKGNKPGTRVCTVRDPVHGVPTLLIEAAPRTPS